MKTRRLKNELELKGFILAAERVHGITYPMDYLKRSRVIGFFDNELNLKGGFLLATRGPFRTLESLPESAGDHGVPETRAAELNALWVEPCSRGKTSAMLWIRMAFEVIVSRKSHFLYTYSLSHRSLGAIYAAGRPTVLYRGLTKILPGMKKPDEESIEVFSIWNGLMVFLRDPTFFFRSKRGLRYRQLVFTERAESTSSR